jgi:hypothetical protein
MSRKRYHIEVDAWIEEPGFVPVFKFGQVERRRSGGDAKVRATGEAIFSQTLRPVGFYVAYSYTLFRKGDDPRSPFYAIF